MTLEEIFKLPTGAEIITQLKIRETPLPDAKKLMDDWDPSRHDVMNPEIRKKKTIIKKEAWDEYGKDSNIINHHEAETEQEEVNRIAVPVEQDIVNIHTAFLTMNEPKLTIDDNDKDEKSLLDVVKSVNKRNKIRFENKSEVRSWLSETEVAEYWYTVDDSPWWDRMFRKIVGILGKEIKPTRRLKMSVWSPFRGDKLYPKFDEYHDLIAFSREYRTFENENSYITHFMTITKDAVYVWNESDNCKLEKAFRHGFKKLPVIYMHRRKPLCADIKSSRERLEKLISNFADCIDLNFFPRMVVEGDIDDLPSKDNGDIVKIAQNGKVYYLTWNQTPEQVKLEMTRLVDDCYSYTDTPRITFENLKGIGNAVSGVSFKYVFMGMIFKSDEEAETVGKFIQRRYNFLASSVGSVNKAYEKVGDEAPINAELDIFHIEDTAGQIDMAVSAVQGGVWSRKKGIIFAGGSDDVDEELALIKKDKEETSVLNQPNKQNQPIVKKEEDVA